ncbi:uncharacterized protein ACLA_046790 [Aspergillus clavatus NRRL 1]|uniref:Fe2OG dioxygenase domain-containing protein n=1 Tax=Aspergillus clavatus (strain ATCC 1007 / CBS 513.65 / DSM 816 / NCTC 3887 / NRRL 1 / QM 1276 / 107) TaxID=344612 RepID=A1CH58_ASPCL|nr:uncharacterized protein ACLA_046790 [Aspergillus clavatus NRRL 1]EAW10213.1 conserved hypothetical protein [Aspergillus clavatus NRRL 1]
MATAAILTSAPIPDPMSHMHFTNNMDAGVESQVTQPQKPIAAEPVEFSPAKHLAYTQPSKVHTMAELGYPESRGVSPIGVSEPFPLFTAEAIQNMRKEVLSEQVLAKYSYSSDLAQCQLRGYAAACAPFVYDAWTNPKTLAIISQVAGVDLVPVMDFEIGHVNLSVQSEEEKTKALAATVEKQSWKAEKDMPDYHLEDNDPIVDWHTDSYPFVCVTMLSDCTNMVGGETALRKGNGEVVKVRGPQMGSAVILQGRYIEHQALRAMGMTERISMVTSFRPRSPAFPDHTVLTTVRPISDLGELYHQFAEYRFEILEDRLRNANKYMRDQKRASRPFNTRYLKQFIREQIQFLEHMDREIVEDEKVIKGVTDDSHLISQDLKLKRLKKRGLAAVE